MSTFNEASLSLLRRRDRLYPNLDMGYLGLREVIMHYFALL